MQDLFDRQVRIEYCLIVRILSIFAQPNIEIIDWNMLKVLEIIQKSTDYLESKGIESARLNAEMLLAEVLNCNRMDLYLQFEKPLDEDEVQQMRSFIARRGSFEPLQYIIGKTNFYGKDFVVDQSVLIPRPETELLVEEVINHIDEPNLRILDIGTGSGIIPIILALECPENEFVAIDISKDAINTAKKNAELNNVNGILNFQNIDVNDVSKIKDLGPFDIVISNPPYISKEEYLGLQKEIVNHEPRFALTDEKEGYHFYEFITKSCEVLLKQNGLLFYEVGMGQSGKVMDFMKENGFDDISVKEDLQGIPRVVMGRKI